MLAQIVVSSPRGRAHPPRRRGTVTHTSGRLGGARSPAHPEVATSGPPGHHGNARSRHSALSDLSSLSPGPAGVLRSPGRPVSPPRSILLLILLPLAECTRHRRVVGRGNQGGGSQRSRAASAPMPGAIPGGCLAAGRVLAQAPPSPRPRPRPSQGRGWRAVITLALRLSVGASWQRPRQSRVGASLSRLLRAAPHRAAQRTPEPRQALSCPSLASRPPRSLCARPPARDVTAAPPSKGPGPPAGAARGSQLRRRRRQ